MTNALPRTDTASALNDFFGSRVPGLLGVTFDSCTPDEVVEWRDMWLKRGVDLLTSLGLPAKSVPSRGKVPSRLR